MELWIPITIAAAFLQNLRTALQKHLTGRLSTLGSAYARFGFGLPFAVVYLALLLGPAGYDLPAANLRFAFFGALGGLAQILGTVCLLRAFHHRNFAVGTTYSKTETVQTAIIGILVLGDPLSVGAALGILISLVGVMAISAAKSKLGPHALLLSWTERAALLGLASGGLFGVSAVCYRAASLSLGGGDFVIRAAFTLVCVLAFQAVVMALYLGLREPGQLGAVWRNWRWTGWVGFTGMLGSAGWFAAMTLQNAAYVRALGQVELVFTFLVSTLVFRERSNAFELAGIAFVVGGILVLLLA